MSVQDLGLATRMTLPRLRAARRARVAVRVRRAALDRVLSKTKPCTHKTYISVICPDTKYHLLSPLQAPTYSVYGGSPGPR